MIAYILLGIVALIGLKILSDPGEKAIAIISPIVGFLVVDALTK